MPANHLRPTPPVPLITGQVTDLRKGSIDACCPQCEDSRTIEVLVRTYDDGAETVSSRDRSDRFARWSIEATLTPEALL